MAADYVTTTDGTGLVHTAPGHGEDDYETGIREGLKVYSPVLANGRFDDTVPEFIRGKTVREANPLIIEELKKRGLLFAEEKIVHSYPHDWRSKKPDHLPGDGAMVYRREQAVLGRRLIARAGNGICRAARSTSFPNGAGRDSRE